MMPRLYSFVLFLSAAAFHGQTAQACTFVDGDQITGRNMAEAVPQLALLPPGINLGYSPAPGIERVFRPSQLQQLAQRYGTGIKITEPVCFSWSLHMLSKLEITAAIKKSLVGHEVDVEISDQSHSEVPDGELTFPLRGLTLGSSKAAIWNGYVVFAGVRRFNTWSQVRLTVHEEQFVAARPIRTGETIDASALKKVKYDGPLRRTIPLQKEIDIAGKCARWPIPAGDSFTDAMLFPLQDIKKEELVTVRVDCGAAHVETQGVAAEAGSRGDVIKVRNPKTGRIFRAKIDARGVVTVVAGGDVGLVAEDKKS